MVAGSPAGCLPVLGISESNSDTATATVS